VALDPASERERVQEEVAWLRRQADALESRLAMVETAADERSE
jgi:ubiquinone biosynthesis protein UbiJ